VVKELDFYRARATELKKLNEDRDELYEEIDQIDDYEWNMPEEVADLSWVFKQIDPFFHDTLGGGRRILSDDKPHITLLPASMADADRAVADGIEKGLKYLLRNADRRRQSTTVSSIVNQSLKYAEVASQVIFLPEQIEAAKTADAPTNRYEAAMRRGPFVIVSHDPACVYARYSDLGPEEVVLITKEDPQKIIDIWGTNAQALADHIKGLAEGVTIDEVTKYDYVSYDARCVYVEMGDGESPAIEIVREEWKYPFLPWAVRKGDKPLLYSAVEGDLYDTINRVRTLRFSEMLRYAGSPKKGYASDADKMPEIDPSSPDLMVKHDTESRIYELAPPQPDPAMGLLHGELRMDAERGTLSSIIMGGEIPAGAAFATINLASHSAMAVLKPYRQLAQDGLADILEIMLLWIHYTKTDVTGRGMGEKDMGQAYEIKWADIDPSNLFIDVTLKADVPTDRQSRALTARNLLADRIISRKRAQEEVGIEDTVEEEELIIEDEMFQNELRILLQNKQFLSSEEVRQAMMQMAMQQIMQQMQAQQQQQVPPEQPQGPPGMGPPTEYTGQRGVPGLEGEMVNPAEGGAVPAEFAPGATREMQTMQSASGEELA